MPSRKQFLGAAIFLTRKKADFKSGTILFTPTIITTFLGPKAIADIRLANQSTFKSSPFSVIALVEQK